MNKYRVMKKGGKSKRFPDLNKDGKITMADILQGRGVKRQAYGGKVEMGMGGKPQYRMGGKVEYGMGGKTEYGIGGAILGGLNALRSGKGLGGAAMAAGKGFITPGSGIAQGAKMAGGLLAGSNNPALAKLGGLAQGASGFLPGGGGVNPFAALSGLFGGKSAKYGMKVKQKLMAHGGASDPPKADFLLRGDVDDMNELQQSRSDRGSAFGTASTDVFMNTGNIPSMPEGSMMREMEDMEDMQPPEDMQEIESRGPRLLRRDMDQELMAGDMEAPEQSEDSFTGFITAPYLRTGQVPTNTKVLNPKTRQYEDRQMEPEEIANYIYNNRRRSRIPSRMMSREDAMKKAMQIMRSRS